MRFDDTSRRLYSTDASIYEVVPLGVVIPRTVEDVQITLQIAGEMRIPLTPRGGGTSLSGQSIGPGIILDVSKYLNRIVHIDREGRRARVQPGVVLDQLNRALEPYDLQFGPDVATASRANLGGMIGNNSAGARSIVYGKTIDHVLALQVLLADGSPAQFAPRTAAEWEHKAQERSLEGNLYRQMRDLVLTHREEIHRRFPRILRRVSGYNLDVLCAGLTAHDHSLPCGLHQLLVGSEGTLAVVTEAELNLLPRPRYRGLLVPQFATLNAAMDALAACLELQPSAVELMDHLLLQLAAGNLALRDTMKAIQGNPEALLMVEFSSDEAKEVADRVEKLQRRLQGVSGLIAAVPALEPGLREPLWNLRRAAMPLLYGMPGDRKPITFVEDTAVAPVHLPEFVRRFRSILHSHGTDGAFYGHASVGCLHIRPVLNLKEGDDVARMRRITEEITDLVLEYGGALSGEHGDGMVRSEWNAKMFGPTLYQAFCQVKHLFDPHRLLNPGKVVDAAPMTENLRYPPGYHPAEPQTVFDYSRQEGFLRSIELCNGSGVCRKMQGGAMCPSYRATMDEKDCTRGRANALRQALAGEAPFLPVASPASKQQVPRALRSRWVHEVFDLCLMCKACKAECPSNVDVAKLKAELLQFYYQDRPRPLGHLLMAHLGEMNRLGSWIAPLLNWGQERAFTRWLLELTAGIDRRRSLPRLHFQHFRRWFARHERAPEAGARGKVVLLDDCFNTYNEPAIAQAAVRVLERAGYEVELAGLLCCGRPMISKGFLTQTREMIRRQLPGLRRRLGEGVPLLGLEPSCLLTIVDEWTELLPGTETRAVAEAAHLADEWLADGVKGGRLELELAPRTQECVLHGHCHQKAFRKSSAPALRLVPGLHVDVLDAGCCGMAGSFGFEKEHYELSVKIANLALLPSLSARPEALVVAPGTSCRHQIRDLAGRRAYHPLEILAEQLPATTSI